MTLAAGIDLSGRTKGVTAIAWVGGPAPRLLEVRQGMSYRMSRGDREIADALVARRPDVIAIDAPLGLPHSVTCDDSQCPVCFPADGIAPSYGSREIDGGEAWKRLGHLEKPPMPTVMVAGIALRAIYLTRLLEREGLEVIETWPMGVYRALARRHGTPAIGIAGDDGWRRALLSGTVAELDARCPADESAERDCLDAVAAAYAGWCRLNGQASPVQAQAPLDREGTIWIPDPDYSAA